MRQSSSTSQRQNLSHFISVFLTRQVDGSPADLVGERSKDDVPDQKPGEEQRSGETDLISLLLDEKPLWSTKTNRNHLQSL